MPKSQWWIAVISLCAACGLTPPEEVSAADAGASFTPGASACASPCGGERPICHEATGQCVRCTATQGCAGLVCDTAALGGVGRCVDCLGSADCSQVGAPFCLPVEGVNRCVACRGDGDCRAGSVCEASRRTCVVVEQGDADAGQGTPDAGTPPVDDGGWDAGACVPRAVERACGAGCEKGYGCVGGVCQLNGSSGSLQVTLRWNTVQDLDLSLLAPLPDGGSCLIDWLGVVPTLDAGVIPGFDGGRPPLPSFDGGLPPLPGLDGGRPPLPPPPPPMTDGGPGPMPVLDAGIPSSPLPPGSFPRCTMGSLDLDANSNECRRGATATPVENIIFLPTDVPLAGRYQVLVNHYSVCRSTVTWVPYEVEVRRGNQVTGLCGVFVPTDADWITQGTFNTVAGRRVFDFTIP